MGEVEWLTVLNGCREGTMYERFSERLRDYFGALGRKCVPL